MVRVPLVGVQITWIKQIDRQLDKRTDLTDELRERLAVARLRGLNWAGRPGMLRNVRAEAALEWWRKHPENRRALWWCTSLKALEVAAESLRLAGITYTFDPPAFVADTATAALLTDDATADPGPVDVVLSLGPAPAGAWPGREVVVFLITGQE